MTGRGVTGRGDAERVVVTGIGIATPLGLDLDRHWARTLAGESGVGAISRFDASRYPTRLAGEISGFTPRDHLPSRLLPQTDHMTRLALVVAAAAMTDAGIRAADLPDFGMGVVTASSAGGFEFGQRELEKLWAHGPEHVSAYQSFAWFYAVNTGQIAIRHGLQGPGGVVVADEAGGLDALASARRHVRRGVPVMLAGGVDSALCPWGLVGHLAGGRLSSGDDATRAYLPFGAGACGSVLGEGGSLMVLEPARSARDRGARVYGEVAGHAASLDPAPGTGRPPALGRTAADAIADAGLAPADIDVVFADGAGSGELDEVEARAIVELFGRLAVPVTAPKAGTGRMAAGGAPVDTAMALLAIRDGAIPPTPNVDDVPERYGIDLVTGPARPAPVRAALVLARGHGGFNSAVVVRAPEPVPA